MLLFLVWPGRVLTQDSSRLNILVYSKTNGYRHEATPAATRAMEEMAFENNWHITVTEDSTFFTDAGLEPFDVVIFLLTIGEILDGKGKKVFKRFIREGKGLVTIHTGTITLQDWPWYRQLIGASFTGHPPVQKARVVIEDPDHPSVDFMDTSCLSLLDEWYSFDKNPRPHVKVVMSIDENTYDVDDNQWFPGVVQRMGDHPVVWYREKHGGRIFQTALGHESAFYRTEFSRNHIKGAILWAGNRTE